MEYSHSFSVVVTALLAEIAEFFRALRAPLLVLVLLTGIFFTVGVGGSEFKGYTVPVPDYSAPSVAARAVTEMSKTLVPAHVTLIAMSPFSAFAAQLYVALALALLIASPLFFFTIVRYLFPALYPRERSVLVLIVLSAAILFGAGSMFGYTIVLPLATHFLYGYAPRIGAEALFSITDLVALSLSFALISGLCFLTPIAMIVLARVGAVGRLFWVRQWRTAFLLFLILSAIITPDGSGVSMVLFAMPLSLLYAAGAGISAVRTARAAHSLQT